MPSLQFAGNFEFNVIRNNLNISEWNCDFNLCQLGRFYVLKSLFDNIAKYPVNILLVDSWCSLVRNFRRQI